MKIIKAETYQEAEKNCPKGYRMLYLWEMMKLIEEGNGKKILNYEKSRWRIFWGKQSKEDVKNEIVYRLDRDVWGYWSAYWYDLPGSYENGRAVYIKEKLT